MSLEKTEAVLLRAFNWSESSRTVVFFSRHFGKIALVDKGGRRLQTRRGRLMAFSRCELTFYSSRQESRGYIREVDIVEQYSLEGEGSLGRLAYASAAAELVHMLLAENEPQVQLYDYFTAYLGFVAKAPRLSLPGLFLAFFLRVLSHLGYHPSLAYCSGCGKAVIGADGETHLLLTGDEVAFFPDRGGVLCPSCQVPGDYYIPISRSGYDKLAALQNGSLKEAATMPIAYAETTRLLEALSRFLACQTDLKTDLKSLAFLEKLKNSTLAE